MSVNGETSSSRLAWRYALIAVLTLIVAAQLAGSLWTLTRVSRGLNAASLGAGGAIYGTLSDLRWIRSEGGAPITSVRSPSPAEAAGIQKGDVVLAWNGVALREHPDAPVRAIMDARPGQSLHVRWRRGSEEIEGTVILEEPVEKSAWIRAGQGEIRMSPGSMFWMQFGPTVLLAVPFLFAGVLIGLLKPGVPVAFLTGVAFLGAGIYCFLEYLPGLLTWPRSVLALSVGLTRLSLFVFPVCFLRVLAVFPSPSRAGAWLRRRGRILLLPLGLLAPISILDGLAEVLGWWSQRSSFSMWSDRISVLQPIVLFVLAAGGLVLWLAQRIEARGRPRTKQRLLELGLVAGFLGILWQIYPPTALVWQLFNPQGSVLPMMLLFVGWFGWILLIACLPLSFAYAVLFQRVFGIRVILRKGIRYLLLSRGVLVVEGLFLFLILEEAIRHGQSRLAGSVPGVAGLSAVASVLVMTGLGRANRPLMHRIDKRFFRESYDARRVLLAIGDGISRLRERNAILKQTGEAIAATLHPSRLAIFLREEGGKESALAWQNPPRAAPGLGEEVRDAGGWTETSVRMDALAEETPWIDLQPEVDTTGGEASADSSPHFELLVAIRTSAGLAGCIALAAKLSEEPYSGEDKELLATVAAQMGLAIENADLLEVAKREAEQARDLAIARDVQRNLFPRALPEANGWEFAAVCRPAKAVGGDYYDLFAIDADHVALAIGDVSGKGLGPSMLMSSAHTMIRSRLRQKETQIADLVGELNEHLYASTSPEMFLTLFVAVLDVRSGELRYVNGGHNPPLLFRSSGARPTALEIGGPIVGIVPGIAFPEGEVRIEPGDRLALFSDGVTEATNAREEMFEEERLRKVLVSTMNRSAPEIVAAVLEAVDRFAEGCEQADDISLVMVRRLEEPRAG